MNAKGCLLKVLLFLAAFVLLSVLPPLGAAALMFLAFTTHFYRKG
jgi:hypothetical protein